MLKKSIQGQRCRSDRGVALVEFGLVLPLVVLLLFGIIDFGWTFGQYLDVRQGAREASRLAAVNYRTTQGVSGSTQSAEIVAELCSRLANPEESVIVIHLPAGRAVGETVTVEVTQSVDSLTGFLDFALPSTLTSSATTRLERTATFNTSATYSAPCP
jgi:Flp pilus assembly protein TadG